MRRRTRRLRKILHCRENAPAGDGNIALCCYSQAAMSRRPGAAIVDGIAAACSLCAANRLVPAVDEAVARRHGAARAVFPRQSRQAIADGAFHNDVVCVGARTCLFFHAHAFEDTAAMRASVSRAADRLFEPVFVEISDQDLPFADAVKSYLFNSMLIQRPDQDRLTLVAPVEVRETATARRVTEVLVASNGPIGEVIFVDVRQSMRNGGGPACLRLRVVLTEAELAATNPAQRVDDVLVARLNAWADRHYRETLSVADLADPSLVVEASTALDALTGILDLGSDFYPFQRV